MLLCHSGCATGGQLDCTNPASPINCYDIILMDATAQSGQCDVCLDTGSGPSAVTVYCDQDTTVDGFQGGWTVIQRRKTSEHSFVQDWATYQSGFGDLETNFWLGLDNMHALTSEGPSMQLHMYMEEAVDPPAVTNTAWYDTFLVGDDTSNYLLAVGTCNACPNGDEMALANGQQFTTYDDDNDARTAGTLTSCSRLYKGGWWYADCANTNPNGLYYYGVHIFAGEGVEWKGFPHAGSSALKYSLGCIDMKIRPDVTP